MATPPPESPADHTADRETRRASEITAPDALLDDKYRVDRVIGEGAFGRVYLATDTRLRRAVAIKELLASRNNTDPEVFQRYLDRFNREARAGGAISHPNAVTVYELEVDRAQNTYLVMEYVDGMDLGTLLEQVGTLPTERAVAIALDVARALEAVHEADIVHRDLKPANIMISRRGGAKLADFGIAQVGSESQRTQVLMTHPGTPLYMSPEQANRYGYLDGRSDLYSLGLVLYEMLVGAAYGERQVPLGRARPDLPPALVAIVERLLQKDLDLRYQTAAEVSAALASLSLVAQPGAATGGYALPAPLQSDAPGVPTPTGGLPAGVPSAYGGPVSQGAGGPYPPYGPASYSPALPPRRGIPAIAIVGIVAAALIVLIGGGLAATHGRGASATATPPLAPTRAAGGAALSSTTTPTATGTTATPSATQAANIRAAGTPASRVSTPAFVTRPASTGPASTFMAGISTARVAGGTPFPTASNQVKLAPGKPLPTAILPNIYVDDASRYTVQYPQEWQQVPGDADTDVQFSFQGTILAGVTSSDLDGDRKPSAQQLADELNATFAKQLTNYKLIDATQVKVAGQDGTRMLYTFIDKGSTASISGYIVAFSTDQTIIIFSGYTPQNAFTARVQTFDNVAASFTGGASLDNTFTDPQHRFTFDYPSGWSERKPGSTDIAASIAPDSGAALFNIVTSATTSTLQQYYDANVKTISDPSTGSKGYRKVSESDTTLSGQPAKLQIYTADVSGNGTILEIYQWFTVINGRGYVLTFSVALNQARDFAGIGPIIANSFTVR